MIAKSRLNTLNCLKISRLWSKRPKIFDSIVSNKISSIHSQPLMSSKDLERFILKEWHDNCVPELVEYVKIPNLSPAYDKDVLTNGLMDQAFDLLKKWVLKQDVKGLKLEMIREPERTPLMLMEVKSNADGDVDGECGTVLMYGHMDKQPPFEGWEDDLGPYKPVIKDGKLYGRGGADDGYATFCAVLALKALQTHGIKHSRVIIIIEASEESGSPDLPFYIQKLKPRIGEPNLIVCLDSGCGNYEQLWITNSLRGLVGGDLSVKIMKEGVHSGDASGVVPATFRIARQLLSRLEDENTGKIKLPALQVDISSSRRAQLEKVSKELDEGGIDDLFPLLEGASYVSKDPVELMLNRWWRSQLVITGQTGLPDCAGAGNVLRPETKLTLSLRLPPTLNASSAREAVVSALLDAPPYGATVNFDNDHIANGWAAPEISPWLSTSLEKASNDVFGKPVLFQGQGGSIPFMAMLGELFPKAQFCVTGVLGPASNAHGPNEFLHIDFSGKLTVCMALLLKDHFQTKVEASIKQNMKRAGEPLILNGKKQK